MTRTMTLLGDSVLDNGRYVGTGPTVSQQVGQALASWSVDLRAVDGSPAREVLERQLALPLSGRGSVVLSAGGNDALNSIHLLAETEVVSAMQVWTTAHDVRAAFRRDYAALLDRIVSLGQPAAVCTIYNPTYDRSPDGREFQRFAEAGLALFNDIIVHEAFRRKLHIIDLRDVCTRHSDFANPIEPSSQGGEKIARAIAAWATGSAA